MTAVNPDRFAQALSIIPGYGKHDPPADGAAPQGACIDELYSWVAGDPWSDQPACMSPAIANVLRRFNDRCGHGAEADARRARMFRELGPIPIGTVASREVERRRVYMAADWSFRVAIPALFRRTVSMQEWAGKLEALQPIVDDVSLGEARGAIYQVRDEAWAKRNASWSKLRKKLAADAAADDAAAVAAAVAADAAAVAAAAAAAADAAADAAAAAADDAAAMKTMRPGDVRRIVLAAQKAREAGGDWSACYRAARPVADEVMAARVTRPFLALREEMDSALIELVKRMAALGAPEAQS